MALTYRFLFDECLTLLLPEVVQSLGYEGLSVRDLNRVVELRSDGSILLEEWPPARRNYDF